VGRIGAFGNWSFYLTKNLGAIGDAGAITSNDPALIAVARLLRNYSQINR
jgi:dTDP-4-amino-4,6-dideoxygalactose transaminase